MEKPQGREGCSPQLSEAFRKDVDVSGTPLLPARFKLGESSQAKKETSIEFNESYFIFPDYRSFQGAAFHIHIRKSLESSLQVSKTLVSSIYLEDKQSFLQVSLFSGFLVKMVSFHSELSVFRLLIGRKDKDSRPRITFLAHPFMLPMIHFSSCSLQLLVDRCQ